MIAAGDWSGEFRLIDARTGRTLRSDRDLGLGAIDCLAFSPDGRRLVATGALGLARWRVDRDERGSVSLEREPLDGALQARDCEYAVISSDSRLLAVVVGGDTPGLWDLRDGRRLPCSAGPMLNGWHNLAFVGPRRFAYVDPTGEARVWDAITDAQVATVGDRGSFANHHIAASPNGRLLAGEPKPSSVGLWDLDRPVPALELRAERSPVWSIAWGPDSDLIALGLSDGGLVLWDLDAVAERLAAIGLAE